MQSLAEHEARLKELREGAFRTREEFDERIKNYNLKYIYKENVGFIVWTMGTGDNYEVLLLRVKHQGRGDAKKLYREAVKLMMFNPPYHSVYAFTRTENAGANAFYTKFGWNRIDLDQCIYKDAGVVLYWIEWNELRDRLGLF